MSQWIRTLLLVLLGVMKVMAQSHLDTSNWKTNETRLGQHLVVFKYPIDRLCAEVPPIFESVIDLNDHQTWKGKDEYHGPKNTLVSARWEYKGWFWQGILGSLNTAVLIHQRPSWFTGSMLDEEAFWKMMKEWTLRRVEEMNNKTRERIERSPANSIDRRTIHQAIQQPSYGFERVRLGNRTWVRYFSPGNVLNSRPSVIYVTALDEKVFLLMNYYLSQGTAKGKNMEWEHWADATGKALVENIEINDIQYR